LVTIGIIGILLSLVLPLLSRTMAASRGFKCQQSLRSIAYDFHIFADDSLHGYRGEPGNDAAFLLENFVESQYGVHEFWAWPDETRRVMPDGSGNDPMRCPEVKGPITLRSNMPCTSGAVSPVQNVSYGFNIRLRTEEYFNPGPRQRGVNLTSDIISASNVPLVWDIDGAVAAVRAGQPHFSGPSLDSPAVFAGDRYWFPALRHNRAGNFAFIDGHVAASARPLSEPTWRWGYSPAH
jgi:prepilin-type processing-associated H-X9-DG protein